MSTTGSIDYQSSLSSMQIVISSSLGLTLLEYQFGGKQIF